ncbi:hypothetical protein BN874_1780008 [Candidatus Contendobacter odensis Run_B_J11]|uniref:Uncharacterized protein n=1 Tax=Candidatus Contendobacter odensis Run_B_J11 TaxID=1400861 RepID=A0A7U7GAK4_9GAMM|nr:hypothetical protein BN874_1780008 [Candidatus Contendobacter odensis Run_B_J11]
MSGHFLSTGFAEVFINQTPLTIAHLFLWVSAEENQESPFFRASRKLIESLNRFKIGAPIIYNYLIYK